MIMWRRLTLVFFLALRNATTIFSSASQPTSNKSIFITVFVGYQPAHVG
jgi:hypothetical protein